MPISAKFRRNGVKPNEDGWQSIIDNFKSYVESN